VRLSVSIKKTVRVHNQRNCTFDRCAFTRNLYASIKKILRCTAVQLPEGAVHLSLPYTRRLSCPKARSISLSRMHGGPAARRRDPPLSPVCTAVQLPEGAIHLPLSFIYTAVQLPEGAIHLPLSFAYTATQPPEGAVCPRP